MYDLNCENFHEVQRRVRTVRRTQVQERVNARGLGRWRLFEAHLTPLLASLQEAGALDDVWQTPIDVVTLNPERDILIQAEGVVVTASGWTRRQETRAAITLILTATTDTAWCCRRGMKFPTLFLGEHARCYYELMEDNRPQAQNCPICATRSDLWPTFGNYRDFDCPKCGRIRITGSALGSFPPKAIARFDCLWLVSWVKRIPAENGPHQNRRLITAAYLDGLETMRRLMTELGVAETEATALAGPVFGVEDTSAAVVARVRASQKHLANGSKHKDRSISR